MQNDQKAKRMDDDDDKENDNTEQEQENHTIPLWLDCDTGHDDAFAILLATHHPRLTLLGLSTVHGNAPLAHTTRNTLSILAAIGKAGAGKDEVDVHPGAAGPFCRREVHAADIHGESGLDGTTLLPRPVKEAVGEPNAVLAMRRALMGQAEGTAWVVATGALTNVALLFATFPELVGHVRGLSIMGGAIGGGFTEAPMGRVEGEGERFGNWTRWAEFNIYCDPEAAKSIFSNRTLAAKTTLIPLDLTHQVLATREVQQTLLTGTSFTESSTAAKNLRQMFHDLLVFFAHTYSEVYGLTEGPPLHDPIAVAVLLEDVAGTNMRLADGGGERWHVDVVTDGLHSRDEAERGQVGRTVVTKSSDHGGVRIPRSLQVESFWKLIEHCIQAAEKAISAS